MVGRSISRSAQERITLNGEEVEEEERFYSHFIFSPFPFLQRVREICVCHTLLHSVGRKKRVKAWTLKKAPACVVPVCLYERLARRERKHVYDVILEQTYVASSIHGGTKRVCVCLCFEILPLHFLPPFLAFHYPFGLFTLWHVCRCRVWESACECVCLLMAQKCVRDFGMGRNFLVWGMCAFTGHLKTLTLSLFYTLSLTHTTTLTRRSRHKWREKWQQYRYGWEQASKAHTNEKKPPTTEN